MVYMIQLVRGSYKSLNANPNHNPKLEPKPKPNLPQPYL